MQSLIAVISRFIYIVNASHFAKCLTSHSFNWCVATDMAIFTSGCFVVILDGVKAVCVHVMSFVMAATPRIHYVNWYSRHLIIMSKQRKENWERIRYTLDSQRKSTLNSLTRVVKLFFKLIPYTSVDSNLPTITQMCGLIVVCDVSEFYFRSLLSLELLGLVLHFV